MPTSVWEGGAEFRSFHGRGGGGGGGGTEF